MKHIKVFESFVPGELNEISSETIKSAADVAVSQGQPGRAGELLKTHFYNYMDKPFLDGTLSDIEIQLNYDKSSIDRVIVTYIKPSMDLTLYIYYDLKNDEWNTKGRELGKREARLLSEIALIMNPQTKYKIASKYLPIKGYGMEPNW